VMSIVFGTRVSHFPGERIQSMYSARKHQEKHLLARVRPAEDFYVDKKEH